MPLRQEPAAKDSYVGSYGMVTAGGAASYAGSMRYPEGGGLTAEELLFGGACACCDVVLRVRLWRGHRGRQSGWRPDTPGHLPVSGKGQEGRV